jgi:hypothetical protein
MELALQASRKYVPELRREAEGRGNDRRTGLLASATHWRNEKSFTLVGEAREAFADVN